MTLLGIDTDGCAVFSHHPQINDNAILIPYPLDPSFNLESDGIHIRPKYITNAPAKGSLIYAPGYGINSLILKDKYVEADSSNYDVLVTNDKVGYRTFKVLIIKQDRRISVYPLDNLDPSLNYINTIYKGTVAVTYNGSELSRIIKIAHENKSVCDFPHLIQFTESPEYDLTPETCRSLFDMCNSPDKETVILGLTSVLSSNLIKYKETCRALRNVSNARISYREIPEELSEAVLWLSHVAISYAPGFSIYQKDLEAFIGIYPDYMSLYSKAACLPRCRFINEYGEFNVVNQPVLYDPL